jgi:hypothetical protein
MAGRVSGAAPRDQGARAADVGARGFDSSIKLPRKDSFRREMKR